MRLGKVAAVLCFAVAIFAMTAGLAVAGDGTNKRVALSDLLTEAYERSLTGDGDMGKVIERARFYQASSTLRIARNGWVSRLDRTGMVARAMALLS